MNLNDAQPYMNTLHLSKKNKEIQGAYKSAAGDY
jgi:hypothetical protein